VKHWIYINEVEPVKYVDTKEKMKVPYWFRWFFKIEKPVEVWEEAFPWP